MQFIISQCPCGVTLGVTKVTSVQAYRCPSCALVRFVVFDSMPKVRVLEEIELWWREHEEWKCVYTDPALNYPLEGRPFPLEEFVTRIDF